MTRSARLALALSCWLLAGVAGWWWHQPNDPSAASAPAGADAGAASAPVEIPSPQERAGRIAAADAMALKRVAAAAPGAAPAAAQGGEELVWRLAALVVRDGERYAVMTARGQPPLQLRAGESLPDGDRIRSIHVDRIEIKSPRGRLRTLHLIEP